jgi:hypothetical protein
MQELIDETTGEIISVEAIAQEPQTDLTPFAWRVGRAIRSIERAVAGTYPLSPVAVIDVEISRLQAVRQMMVEKLESSRGQLLALAQEAMDRTNTIKLKLDGVGTFRYRKLPDKVVDGAIPFDSLTLQQRAEFAEAHPECINLKVIYQPDKKAIKGGLEDGGSLPYFALEPGGQKFEFAMDTAR